MDIIEAMEQRRSVRTYDGNGLTLQQVDDLLRAIDSSSSPFGGNVTIRLKQFDLKGEYKPGTYGTIRGAQYYFLIALADNQESALSAGFRFEQVVLKAWQLGLGTCWIAATFKGSDFDRGMTWPQGEQLRIISPVGVAADHSLREKLTRLSLGSRGRKPFDELFFTDGFQCPLPSDNVYAPALEMMRLAPSSKNSQPWRATVDGDMVHFYYVPKNAASVLDCGIGLCHFYETEKYHNRSGRFVRLTNVPVSPSPLRYLISYAPE